jgi:8-oxo-dGTP diphosphatase
VTSERTADFYAQLPTKRVAAGVLLTDEIDRFLLVRPTYKRTWEIPGGVVEAEESPRDGVVREVLEELGLSLRLGRLVCIDWIPADPPKTEGLMLIYDGGLVDDGTAAIIQLPAAELSDFRFVDLDADGTRGLISDRMERRLRAALAARHDGTVAELQNGYRARPTSAASSVK